MFIYPDEVDNWESYYIAVIPPGITSKESLLECYFTVLNFPGWFGFNGDALSDCLGYLDWIEQKKVLILFEDVPQLNPHDHSVHIDILLSAVQENKKFMDMARGDNDEEKLAMGRELYIAFPPESKDFLKGAA